MANNARIYSTFKDLSIREARVIEETFSITGFPILPLRSRTHWHGLKRRGGIKCEKLGGFITEYNFRFFYEKNDGISLGTRFMTALAKV